MGLDLPMKSLGKAATRWLDTLALSILQINFVILTQHPETVPAPVAIDTKHRGVK